MPTYSKVTISTYNKTALDYVEKVRRYAPGEDREKFIAHVKPNGNILDAGCGPGRDSNYFAIKGFAVTGIDLSEGLLSYAREHAEPGTEFLTMDLRNITLPDQSFDGIWACASLLHLTHEEIPAVMRKFNALLKENGILFILVKEGTGEKMVKGGTTPNDERFFSYYSEDELRRLVTDAGLSVFETYTWDQRIRNPERPSENWIALFAKKR